MDNNINTLNETKVQQTTTPEQPVNRLYFNAREWSFNKDCEDNVGSRSFMQGPDGIISEAFTIGDWGYNWTEIVTKSLILPKNMLHTFTFWLNGGENDNNNEVCRRQIIFNNDYENRYTYNLNRNFIKPLKKCRGWELYEIPFITADNEYTQLRFVAQRAYMTVMNAKAASEYADLPEILDEFEGERPRRHNIVFDDGFPTNTWYSTKALREKKIRRQLSGEISWLVYYHDKDIPEERSELKRLLDALGAEDLRKLIQCEIADSRAKKTDPDTPDVQRLRASATALREILDNGECYNIRQLAITTRELLERRLVSSEQEAEQLLNALFEMVLDKPSFNNKLMLLDMAEKSKQRLEEIKAERERQAAEKRSAQALKHRRSEPVFTRKKRQ